MTARLTTIARFVALLCCAASAFAQDYRLDIALEGPFILYVDHTFAKWPVLILVAPDVGDNDKDDTFHVLQVNSGDGYYFDSKEAGTNRIYCLAFDGTCARQGAKSLRFHDYSDNIRPLPVNLGKGEKAWDWVTASRKNSAFALVLPMPDSYSNDGVWHMRFGAKFDQDGSSYNPTKGERSIGVQLHYNDGPHEFNLLHCNDQKQPSTDNCMEQGTVMPPKVYHTHISNTGTLRILMRAPNNNDNACDPHVRHIYPRMMDLIDKPANPTIAVIDPAHDTDDNGDGMYDPPLERLEKKSDSGTSGQDRCLDNDDQNPNKATHTVLNAGNMENSSWTNQLKSIAGFSANPDLSKVRDQVLLPEINAEYSKLKVSSPFLRISQVRWLQELVNVSKDRTEGLLLGIKDSAANQDTNATIKALQSLEDDEEKYLAAPPTKSGNDCKAPIMMVGSS